MFSRLKSNLFPSLAALLCGLVSVCCSAQQPIVEVKGTVVDAISQQPIARVLVNGHEDSVLTDSDGHFTLHLRTGSTAFEIRRPGYRRSGNNPDSIRVAEGMPEVRLAMIPDASIVGRVTLSNGDDADGVRVQLYAHRVRNGHPAWTSIGNYTTDSEGVFRIGNLAAPAQYMLHTSVAHDRIGAVAPGSITYGYAPAYYPGVNDPAAAGVLSLTPGQQADVEFTLNRQPLYPVSFVIGGINAPGAVPVQIYDAGERRVDSSTRWDPLRNAVGINLPNGRYHAEVHVGENYGRVDFIIAGSGLPAVPLNAVPLRPLYVHIRQDFTAGGPPAGSVQILHPGGSSDVIEAPRAFIGLQSAEETSQQAGFAPLRRVPGSTDPDLFETGQVLPGRYWVGIMPFNSYVSSATAGGIDLGREPLTVGAGGSSAPIEITLRNDSGAIHGQFQSPQASSDGNADVGNSSSTTNAVSNQPAVRAHIYAIPLSGSTMNQPEWTGSNGTFDIQNLPPGSYHLLAFDGSMEIDTSDAQQMQQLAGKGQTVTVEAGGTANVQIELLHVPDYQTQGSIIR